MRIQSDHRLLVNVVRDPSGELLGQAGLDELAHLVDETRYDAVSRGILPDEPARLAARIEPVPEASDLPSLAGVRVSLWHDATAGTLFTREFPKGIAGSRGRELVSALIGAGILQEGDEYRVRLVAAPRAERPRGRFASPGQPETELDEIPFPVQRGSLSGWGVGPEVIAAADRHRPVFLARSILERATTEAIRHGKQETGMLVLGALIDDEDLPASGFATSWAVVLTEQVEVQDGQATATSFIFPPESFRRARQLADLRGRWESVIGSQHSHGWRCAECQLRCPIQNLFFSTDDERMAQQFPIYGTFLVLGGDPDRDPDRPVANLYVRQRGLMRSIAFGTF